MFAKSVLALASAAACIALAGAASANHNAANAPERRAAAPVVKPRPAPLEFRREAPYGHQHSRWPGK